ncbi:MAG: MATE family efflux transporter [Pseudomonadota bacterium]
MTGEAVSSGAITYRRVASIALPVVFANATVPLQGAIDTAIIGNQGEAVLLAAVTLGASIVTLLFSSFNFLQVGVSGLTAQAYGAGDRRRVMNTRARAFVVAAAVSAVLILLQVPIASLGLMLFEGSAEAERLARNYVLILVWGAPAHLGTYALIGWFTGLERTNRLLELQLVVSLSNVALNLVFVVGLGWGVEGVALGTAIAAWIGLGVGVLRARAEGRRLAPDCRLDWARVLERAELRQVMALNRDIFVRTLLLTGSLAWVARLGSTQGDVVLAANGILLQFLTFSAYALDGFAMAAETLVGQAFGGRDRSRLRRAVIVSTVAAFLLSIAFAALATGLSGPIVRAFTNVDAVREVAFAHILWASLIPVIAVFAFQLDGVFVGAAEGAAMRNAMIVSVAVFVPSSLILVEALGNHGLWLGIWIWLAMRALTLAALYPRLEARLARSWAA